MTTHRFPEELLKEKLQKALDHALHRGMHEAEASIFMEDGFSVSVRRGEVETLEQHQGKQLHITVAQDHRTGSTSTSDLSHEAILAAVDKACAISQYAGVDEFSGLPEKEELAFHYPDLKLYHHWDISIKEAIDIGVACDITARGVDKRITDAEGSHVSSYDSIKIYGNTRHFLGSYAQSLQTISCNVVAQSGQKMQQDYEYTVARLHTDLEEAELVAQKAALKVLKKLESQPLSTRRCPVIFHAPVAKSLLGHFVSAISGRNLYQQSSFLLDHLGKTIFPEFIHIYQQPHLIGGLASTPFDQEGVITREIDFVRDGVLQNYALGTYSGRKLKMKSTGNAGGVFNLSISDSPEDLAGLLKKMDRGLLVTDLMGQGVNIVTGSYSRGAAGFWVEHGQIQFAVDEITIAGQLQTLFAHLVAVANDTDTRGSIRSGSILIEEMTVAGE
jgi:PmbA protein